MRTRPGIEVLTHELDRRQQLAEAFERVVLALERDEDAVGGRQGIDREQAERGRAVQQDEVVGSLDGLQDPLELAFAPGDGDELHLRTGEAPARRQEREPFDRRSRCAALAGSTPPRRTS